MSDEAALLAAIYANHDEDTPRLVYADWLDEHDRHEEAELIRVQVESPDAHWPEMEAKLRDQWLPHLDAEGKKRVHLGFNRGLLETVRIEHGIPEDYRGLGTLPGVRELWISDSALTEDAVRAIASFDQLDELGVWRTTFQTAWLELLDQLPPWTTIDITSSEADFAEAWDAFQQRRIARVSLAPVDRLRQMFRRQLGEKWQYREYLPPGPIRRGMLRGPSEFDIAALSRISELEHIKLADGIVSQPGLQGLARLPNLRSVELFRTEAVTLAPLAAFTKLERLRVTAEVGVLTSEGFEGLERLTNLQELLLNGGAGALHDGAFQRLAPLKQLRSLELHFGALKEDPFSVLAGLSKLEVLKLHGPTRDADVRHLTGLTSLSCLVLAESGVTDAALQKLTRLTNLRTLFVRGEQAQVTEAGAQQLAAQLSDVTILLGQGVVKTPRTEMVFHRRMVGDCASILCPTGWAPPDYRKDYDGVWSREDGWRHIIYPLDDDRSAEIVCYALGFASTESAEQAVEAYAKADYHANPQVLERAVVPLAGTDSASCVIRMDERQELLCKVNLSDDCITLFGRVTPARFEEFRRLFLFVARSLRVGDEAKQGVGEEIIVSVSEM